MIKRDGTCTSLWQDTVAPYNSKEDADNNFLYNVIIVGGGITGISTGFSLQVAGKSV